MTTTASTKECQGGDTPPGAEERRKAWRLTVRDRRALSVVIRCGQGTLCQGYLMNLSTQGMLVEFPKGQLPPVPVSAQVSIKVHYSGDSIWVPGVVRHRMGAKMGFYFPSLAQMKPARSKHPLSIILQALSGSLDVS
jgi:hypothetical protein